MGRSERRRARERKANREKQGENRQHPAIVEMEHHGGDHGQDQAGHYQEQTKRFWRRPDFWMAAFTFLLVVVTSLYAWFSFELWDVTDQSLKEAARSNRLVATSNDISRAGNEAQARAWMVHSNEMTMNCPSVGAAMKIDYRMLNSGNRPAIKVRKHAVTLLVSGEPGNTAFPFPQNPPYPEFGKRVQSVSVVGPQQPLFDTIQNYQSDKKWNAHISDILARTWTLFVYGKIDYEDGYGVSRQTTWCYYWNPEGECRYSFHLCDRYNDAN